MQRSQCANPTQRRYAAAIANLWLNQKMNRQDCWSKARGGEWRANGGSTAVVDDDDEGRGSEVSCKGFRRLGTVGSRGVNRDSLL